MNILLLGAPGSGKGSQAELLLKDYGLVQISTGDLLRQAVANKTKEGVMAESFMNKGELVPDELVLKLLSARMQNPDCKEGVVFDGFPRTVEQAKLLDNILTAMNKKIDLVFNIDSPFDVITRRLLSRRVCGNCKKNYNMISNPPKGNNCDECGGKIITRDDDNEPVVKNRLEVYEKSTRPLIEYYESKGVLVNIDGNRAISEISYELKGILIKKLGIK
jgi:adenylate kinase